MTSYESRYGNDEPTLVAPQQASRKERRLSLPQLRVPDTFKYVGALVTANRETIRDLRAKNSDHVARRSIIPHTKTQRAVMAPQVYQTIHRRHMRRIGMLGVFFVALGTHELGYGLSVDITKTEHHKALPVLPPAQENSTRTGITPANILDESHCIGSDAIAHPGDSARKLIIAFNPDITRGDQSQNIDTIVQDLWARLNPDSPNPDQVFPGHHYQVPDCDGTQNNPA